MKKTPSAALTALPLAMLVAGCGGGGSDAGVSLSTPYAVGAAYKATLGMKRDVTLAGKAAGLDYTVRLVTDPRGTATFPIGNISAQVTRQTITITGAGSTSPLEDAYTYYIAETGRPLGSVDGTTCTTFSGYTAPPANATIDGGGTLYTESDVGPCATPTPATNQTPVSWALEQDAGSAQFCQKTTVTTSPSGEIKLCFEVLADGTLGTRVRFSTTVFRPSVTLVARNY